MALSNGQELVATTWRGGRVPVTMTFKGERGLLSHDKKEGTWQKYGCFYIQASFSIHGVRRIKIINAAKPLGISRRCADACIFEAWGGGQERLKDCIEGLLSACCLGLATQSYLHGICPTSRPVPSVALNFTFAVASAG